MSVCVLYVYVGEGSFISSCRWPQPLIRRSSERKSPLKSEGREDVKRGKESEWGDHARGGWGEAVRGGKEDYQKMKRFRLSDGGRDHQKGLYTQNTVGCVKCSSKGVCLCVYRSGTYFRPISLHMNLNQNQERVSLPMYSSL